MLFDRTQEKEEHVAENFARFLLRKMFFTTEDSWPHQLIQRGHLKSCSSNIQTTNKQKQSQTITNNKTNKDHNNQSCDTTAPVDFGYYVANPIIITTSQLC